MVLAAMFAGALVNLVDTQTWGIPDSYLDTYQKWLRPRLRIAAVVEASAAVLLAAVLQWRRRWVSRAYWLIILVAVVLLLLIHFGLPYYALKVLQLEHGQGG